MSSQPLVVERVAMIADDDAELLAPARCSGQILKIVLEALGRTFEAEIVDVLL